MKVVDSKDDSNFGKLYNWEHSDTPIIGINGKHFLDFTSENLYDFDKIDDEICLALAKSDLQKIPTVQGVMPPKLKTNMPNHDFENQVMYNYSGDRSVLSDLCTQGKRKYLFFKHKSLLPWYFILELKPNIFKTKNKDLYPWDDIINTMPHTKSFIESLPFKEIGRVVIYGSWPDSKVYCHRDNPPTENFSHHINFNPGGYRPVYVYDSINDKKYYLPRTHKIYAYNTTDYHGVDPVAHFSYTVRVDGIYNDYVLSMLKT
jgi:hypothetical protein